MRLLKHLPRFQRAYRELDRLAEREAWSREELAGWQLDRLNAVWQHAIQHVPYYIRLAAERDLPPRFADLDEYTTLVPLLPKSVVRNDPEGFLSQRPARGGWHRSGGSTGTPMGVYWSHDAHREMLRARYRMEAAWGLDIFDQKVFLWGHSGSFAPGLAGRISRWRRPIEDWLRNRLRLSAYRMGRHDLLAYLKKIQSFRPASIYGYSTALYLLGREAAGMDFSCDALRVAILSGEPAYPHCVEAIERGFGVPAAIEYGAVECGFIAGQVPGGAVHVREDMTLVETLPRDDGLFDIVLTVLNNPSFPLMRYSIDDVTDAPVTSPERGFATLSNIGGRKNDLVVSRTGRFVHSLGVKHVFENLPNVRRFQARQQADGHLLVTVETSDRQPLDTSRAERRLTELLEGFAVTVTTVDEIPCTLAGKHRWIVSELAEKRLSGKASAGTEIATAG